MSGHSKWSTIKRKKAAADARRGQIFTRLAREIAVAAREGGGDPETNFALRLAVDRAKAANMPKDNIENAIRRGTGEDKSEEEFVQLTYEGYAPHGVALMIEVITDNKNRTVADLRHQLTRAGGNLAEAGSVAWQFEQAAYFEISPEDYDEEHVFLVAVDGGAEDVSLDGAIEVVGPAESFKKLSDTLTDHGIRPRTSELRWIANTPIVLEPKVAAQVLRVIEGIEELDDVQEVYSNLEITDEAVQLLETA